MKKKILPWPGDPVPRFTIRIGDKRYTLDLSNVLSKLNDGPAPVIPIDKQNSAASGSSRGPEKKALKAGVRGKLL
jgi:hypothetical protein